MKKRSEQRFPESAWNRSADDEPLFILCARDVLAPKVVRDWIARGAESGVPKTTLEDAASIAFEMEDWQSEHGYKIPD